jgi:hypothetical protein
MSREVDGLIANAKLISDEVKTTFGNLSAEQLNWKPNASEWGVGQCFDHLITTNDLYLANIQKVADGTHQNNWFSIIPFFPNLVGQQLKKAVSPDSVKKIKTFPVFEPSLSDISDAIIEDFGKHQDRLISLMEAVKDQNIRKIKIPTPISEAVNVRLSDALEVIVMHERRHFNQAKRVTEMEGFPKI